MMNTEKIKSMIKDVLLHSLKDTLEFKMEESQSYSSDIPGLYPVAKYTITWETPHKFTKYSAKVMKVLIECCKEIMKEETQKHKA